METKQCLVCKEEKGLDLFYKHSNGKPRGQCKSCHYKYNRFYAKTRAKEVAAEKAFVREQRERGLKTCPECKQELAVESFYKSSTSWDGLDRICKQCTTDHHKRYYSANPQLATIKAMEWRKKNPEKVKVNYDKKKDRVNAHRRTKAKQTSEKKKAKRHADPKFNIDILMSNQVRKVLKEAGSSKQGLGWERCVGYTIEDLANHLESLFTDEMSWENQGSFWEIDHIIPKSWYTYSSKDDEEFKKCWALKNLQPLTKTENASKQYFYAGTPSNPIYGEHLYDDTRVTNEDMRRLRPSQTNNTVFKR